MPPRIYVFAQGVAPQMLPRSYGWGLQFRWTLGAEDLYCSKSVLGMQNVVLGKRLGVRVAIDFPKSIDGKEARWDLEDLDRVNINRLRIRAIVPKSRVNRVATTKNLTEEPVYVRARSVALELVNSFFDLLARESPVAPRLEAPLPIGLCQVFYGRRERSVATTQAMTLFTAKPPRLTAASLPTFARDASRRQPLRLAWRLFRRARQLGEDEDSLSEAVVVAMSAMEVGLAGGLVSKAPSNSQRKNIQATRFAVLLGAAAPWPKEKDWSTVLFGATLKTAAPADFDVVNAMRLERNDIVHEGTSTSSSWAQFRLGLNSVGRALEWVETQL